MIQMGVSSNNFFSIFITRGRLCIVEVSSKIAFSKKAILDNFKVIKTYLPVPSENKISYQHIVGHLDYKLEK